MREIAYSVNRLVARHQGSLPVLLTCPHGGDEKPTGVQNERTGAGLPPECEFEKNTDSFTRTIIRGVAQVLFDVFGHAPYVVFANFDRAYIDANRPSRPVNCAFEDNDARPFYDEYHNTIRKFVDEIRRDHGGLGLLFDIHGTKKVTADPADLYFGTLNGASIETLNSRDSFALARRRSLAGFMRQQGYVVSAKTPETIPGGFTLETYGSKNSNGLDAIQIEIEASLRTDANRRGLFVEDLGFALSSLIARYSDTEAMVTFRTANFLPRLP
jgi:N-formylglutamate amidohydrolase